MLLPCTPKIKNSKMLQLFSQIQNGNHVVNIMLMVQESMNFTRKCFQKLPQTTMLWLLVKLVIVQEKMPWNMFLLKKKSWIWFSYLMLLTLVQINLIDSVMKASAWKISRMQLQFNVILSKVQMHGLLSSLKIMTNLVQLLDLVTLPTNNY